MHKQTKTPNPRFERNHPLRSHLFLHGILTLTLTTQQIWRNFLHLHAGCAAKIPQLLHNPLPHGVEIFPVVLVLISPIGTESRVEDILWCEVFTEGIPELRWELSSHICIRGDGCLVAPETADVARGISTTADEKEWEAEGLDEFDAGAVGADVEIEAAEAVGTEGVRTALEDDRRRAVGLYHRLDDGFEEAEVVLVIDAVAERDVEGVVFSGTPADIVPVSGTGEEVVFVVFVEGQGHHAVGAEEGLFHPVAMVHVYVDIEDAGVVPEELEDCEDNVVNVAEPGCLAFLRVV